MLSSAINATLQEAHDFLSDNNYVDAILALQRLDDLYRGVESTMGVRTRVSDDGESQSSYHYYDRTFNKDNADEQYNGWCNYALLGINLLFALNKMIELHSQFSVLQPHVVAANYLKLLHQQPEDAELIFKLLHEKFLEPRANKIFDETAEVHAKSTRAMVTGGFLQKEYDKIQSGIELLHVIKQLNHLDFPPQQISTRFEVQAQDGSSYTARLREDPLCHLTDELEEHYLTYESKDWYINANSTVRPYLAHALEKINAVTTHNREHPNDKRHHPVLSTELRHFIPGLRNAYRETLYVKPTDSEQQEVSIFQGYHFGHPGHMTQGNNTELTELALHQFKALSHSKKTFINTLVSPNKINSDEGTLTQQVMNVTDENEHFHFSNTPIGSFRVVTDKLSSLPATIDDGITAQLRVVEQLSNIIIDLNQEFIETVEEQESDLKEIEAQLGAQRRTMDVEQRLFRNQQALLKLLRRKSNHEYWWQRIHFLEDEILNLKAGSSSTEMYSGNNVNLMLAMRIRQIMFAYGTIYRILKPQKSNLFVALGDGCVGGKDRGAILRLYTHADNLCLYLQGQDADHVYDKGFRSKLLISLAESTHFQKLAGHAGSSFGAYGIKEDSKGAFLSADTNRVAKILFQKTAQYNSKPPSASQKSRLNYAYAPLQTYSHASQRERVRDEFIKQVTEPKEIMPLALEDTNESTPLRLNFEQQPAADLNLPTFG